MRVGRLRQFSASVSLVSRGGVVCLRSRVGEGVWGFLERRVGMYCSLVLDFVKSELREIELV